MGKARPLHALRDHGQIRPGQKVLINGASGGVGTFGVQVGTTYVVEAHYARCGEGPPQKRSFLRMANALFI
jgi:NADPH:quinone reductase-like Zn-dependent oxidoreductase